jgi:hypothetical protein
MSVKPSECLGALVVGLHFSTPWFSIANSFNNILDEVSTLQGFEIISMSHHELAFRTEQLSITLNQAALMVKSPLFIAKKLLEAVGASPPKHTSVRLPLRIFAAQPEFTKTEIQVSDEEYEKKRKNFFMQAADAIGAFDKLIVGGLRALRFIGLVQYYFVPLDKVRWVILDSFTKQAGIEGAENSEKYSVNRFDFPEKDSGEKECFIFVLDRPRADLSSPDMAAASFDFQIIPKEPTTIDDFGGPRTAIQNLGQGLTTIVSRSAFMNFEEKG